jgi:hypothetical protein
MDAHEGWLRALEIDLDALAQAESDLDRDAEVAERIRIERSQVGLFDRVIAAGGQVELRLSDGGNLKGRIQDGASHWLLVEQTDLALVPRHAVIWARSIGPGTRPAGVLHARSIASVYRQWARDRAEVRLHLSDGSHVVGRLAAAYADHVDLLTSEHGILSIAFESVNLTLRPRS